MVRRMPVELRDFEPLLSRDGPISVIDEHGGGVTYSPSGIARAVDPDLAQVLTLEEIQIVLLDEMTRPVRVIRGDHIVKIAPASPGWTLVVDQTVEPDEGSRVRTRGA
jgi:hypothetical protein